MKPLASHSGHSASSTALSTLVLSTPASRSATNLPEESKESSASSSDIENNCAQKKPQIVRKKSGETVKSSLKLSSLVRHQSMPTTSKMVHFDDNLERVRHFLHSEKPAAVSAQSSPTEERPKFHWGNDSDESESDSEDEEEEDPRLGFQRYLDRTEWQISLPNFKPTDHSDQMVFVENVFLSSDKNTLLGHIAVKNIAFEKHVCVKYSIDDWKTTTVLTAEYNDDVRRKRRVQGYDRFTFSINMGDFPQHAISAKSIFFCVRYNTPNGEFWDNNQGRNYQVDFMRVTKVKSGVVARPQSVRLPARHHRRSKSSETPTSSVYTFGQEHKNDYGREDENDIFNSIRPKFRTSPSKENQFTSRYDFGASLKSSPSKPGKAAKSDEAKLALNAKSYQELIDSYCFFGGKPDKAEKLERLGKKDEKKEKADNAGKPALAVTTQLFEASPEVQRHEWKMGVSV